MEERVRVDRQRVVGVGDAVGEVDLLAHCVTTPTATPGIPYSWAVATWFKQAES
ncbi:hypothetical protein [Streptomyces sp. NPDC051452]|uniref:hypothetical protein n=1 Tax=Streptomyces sp. NPDC051452 TaxID=3365654 RepID=UPI0037909CB0